jgi:DNA polymerase-1
VRRTITDYGTLLELLPTWLGKDFSFDVETTGLDNRRHMLVGVALYFEDGEAYYIALQHTVPLWLPGTHANARFIEERDCSRALSWLFAQTDTLMVAHNAKFDMHFLRRIGVQVQGRLADTLLAAQLLDENRDNGLKSLSDTLLDMKYEKYTALQAYKGFGSKEILGVPLDQVANYAMNDVEATWKLYQKFVLDLEAEVWKGQSLLDVFNQQWMPLLIVLFQMEARGIALDIDLVKSIREEYVEIAEKHRKAFETVAAQMILKKYNGDIPPMYLKPATEEDLESAYEDALGYKYVEKDGVSFPIITHDMIGKNKTWRPRILTVNSGSNTQLYDIVYNLAGVELPEKVRLKATKGQKESADKDNLETISFYMGDKTPPIIKDLLEWRKASKFVSTYLDRFIADGDPDDYYAMHTWFSLAIDDSGEGGTATGRLSSRGPNLQNIPSRGEVGKKARSMFVARPGYTLVVADLSQAELRMLAHYSRDPALLKAFEENQDLHILTGAGFARMSYEELKEWYDDENHPKHDEAKKLRMLGKTGNFALTYGMGARKFQRYLIVNNKYEITIEQAQEWIDGYNETYAGATAWKRKVTAFVKQHGYVATFGGRKRRLPGIFSKNSYERGYAERQGINAIIQGSVGDVICFAMTKIQPALVGLGGSILLQVHDELVAEVPIENGELAKVIIEDLLVRDCNKKLSVQQVADASLGLSWGGAKG